MCMLGEDSAGALEPELRGCKLPSTGAETELMSSKKLQQVLLTAKPSISSAPGHRV